MQQKLETFLFMLAHQRKPGGLVQGAFSRAFFEAKFGDVNATLAVLASIIKRRRE